MDVVHINTLKDNYNGYLDLVKKHRVNLIIELPPVTSNEDLSQRHRTHLSRVQKMASVAGKVYIIAPRGNGYWNEWES